MNTVEPMTALYTAANAGEWIDLGDHRGRPLVTSQHNGGAFLLCETEVDFLGGVPPHIHSREEETFYILDGEFEITVGDQTILAVAGDTAFAPRDIAHTWRCTSENGGRLLLLVTPGANFETFIMEVAAQNIVPTDPSCIGKLIAMAESHGMTMLPPQQ